MNLLDFQYVPGLRNFNVFLTKIRMSLLKLAGAKIGKNSIIRPGALIVNPKNIYLGENTIIGRNSIIMNYRLVSIGNNVEIGPSCVFQTNDHLIKNFLYPLGKQGTKYSKIIIKDNCYLGSNVTLLLGSTVEQNVLIGAKSLVNKNLKSYSLYAGVPVSFIKKLSKKQ